MGSWLCDGRCNSMENNSNLSVCCSTASDSVRGEVIGFFKTNPFLLVSETRLASLLCRPPDMVCEAVRELEEAGLLTRRYGETLLGVEEALAALEPR
jgi:hypothetical protein